MSVLETVLISFLTTLGTASVGFLFYFLRVRMKERSQSKAELEKNKRQSFQKLLDEHADLLLGKSDIKSVKEWVTEFSNMSKSILLWGSDNVLFEYGQYVEKYEKDTYSIEEREIHFAKAILAFRKELGYRNRKNKITPIQIVLIFRSGYKGNI